MRRRCIYWRWIAPLLAVVTLAGACDRNEQSLVVYVSADEQVARPILAQFTAETGIQVSPLFDTELTKTTGLANRLRRERDVPRADVFWSSEPFAVQQLAEEGVIAAASSERLALHPEIWRDPGNRWYAFAGRGRVVVFDPNRLSPEQQPRMWTDLLKPIYRDRIVMADPRFGTTSGHMGALKVYWDTRVMPGYYAAWLDGLAENGVRMLPGGNAQVVDAVARGEALVGMTDTDDVWAAQERGVDVALCYPRHDLDGESGGGTLLIPNTVGRIAGSPNPEAAHRFLEFMVSQHVESALHDSPSHNVPLVWREEIDIAPRYIVDDPMIVSISESAEAMPAAVDEAMRRLDPDRIEELRKPGIGRTIEEIQEARP